MKKQIMKTAWTIARNGQENFGGSVKSYLSESLKIAWKQAKTGETNMEHTIIFKNDVYNERRYSRPWMAKISVSEMKPQYSFDGQFLGEHGRAGETMMKAETGSIIAIGQKDNRRGNSINRWYKVVGSSEKIEIEEGCWDECEGLEQIEKAEAVKYLMGL